MSKKICYITTISVTIKAFFIEQLKYLSENGYEVTVICSSDKELKNILGAKIKYIPIDMPRGLSLLGTIKSIRLLSYIFRKEKFDLIQYSTPNAGLYAAIASALNNVKVRNYHLMGLRYEGATGILRTILKYTDKIACLLSTHIECVSPSSLEVAIREGLLKKEKGVVVWNGSSGGIDIDRFHIDNKENWRNLIREKLSISNDKIVFGFVGRITRDKGVNELIYAFNKLQKKHKNVQLLIIGDFEEEQLLNTNYIEWAKKSKLVCFTGLVGEIEKYYSAIDVLVLPSYREGFGNVVIEAQAMGIPVIVSNIPGPTDAMKNHITGITIQPKNVKELYNAMDKMLDEQVRGKMSKEARQYVINYFDSKILCKYILDRKNKLLSGL